MHTNGVQVSPLCLDKPVRGDAEGKIKPNTFE